MSLTIDRLYINFLTSRLERFKWIRPNVAVCRCPFCGDGRKGTKTRFYIYENVKYGSNAMNVDCKNCGYTGSFYNFLKGFDSALFNQYRLDNFREKFGREPRQLFTDLPPPIEEEKSEIEKDFMDGATKLCDLPLNHPAVKYVLGRMIPDKYLEYLMYTDNFRQLTAEFKNSEYAQKMPEDARLIIPFYDEYGKLNCYQGRSLDPSNKMRYISVKKNDSVVKTFGMDKVDRSKEVRVCEGPIDSLFIKNCLAAADADLTRVKGDVYIYDSQYRNPDVVRHINKCIEAGHKVVLFPKEFEWKDINESVMDGGLTSDDIENLIRKNTYQGLKAKLVFSKLRGS